MWTWDWIEQWSGATAQGDIQGCPSGEIREFSIDTRTLQPGDIFIALQGNSDGHRFVEEAFKKGASGAMVSYSWISNVSPDLRARYGFIVVPDTFKGLQALAQWHRAQFSIPVAGITGSSGKTTTKEMLAGILSHHHSVLKTQGNFNNAIGLPLTLLQLAPEHKAAVLEMGISQPGEMNVLCDIAQPTLGVITHIGSAHLEYLGDLQGVANEKRVLFDRISEEGIVIINRDDPYLASWTGRARQRWTYALHTDADITASEIHHDAGKLTFTLQLKRDGEGGGRQKISLSLLGAHQVYNAMAASAAALALGYAFDDIREGLRSVSPLALRGEVCEINGATILLDAYNANPDSMCAALQTLASFSTPLESSKPDSLPCSHLRKVAIVGDMLELGTFSPEGHRKVGQCAAQNRIDRLIAVGQWSAWVAQGAQDFGMAADAIETYATLEEMNLSHAIQQGDLVLIKGSRGMKMERILSFYKRDHAV